MKPILALLWKEERQVRPDGLALVIIAVGMHFVSGLGALLARGPDVVSAGVTIFAVVPVSALLLGATVLAGDGALGYLRARAISWPLVFGLRVLVRLAYLALVTVAGGVVIALSPWPPLDPPPDFTSTWLFVIPWALTWFTAAGVGSALVRRPPVAALLGVALGVLSLLPLFWSCAVAWYAWTLPVLVVLLVAVGCPLARLGRRLPSSREVMRDVAIGLLALVVLFVLWQVVGGAAARWRAHLAEREWARAGWELDELADRYPSRPANTSALELEALAAAVGLKLAPKSRSEEVPHERPSSELDARSAVQALRSYLNESDDAEPPDELRRLFELRASEIDAIRDHLLDSPPVEWESEFERGFAAPIPNLAGYLGLQRLLLARARASAHDGHREPAIADLEASWRLSAGLAERPELITQLVEVAQARWRARVIREVVPPAAAWGPRLDVQPYADGLIASLQTDAWHQLRMARAEESAVQGFQSSRGGFVDKLVAPWYRWQAAGLADDTIQALVFIRDQAGCGEGPGGIHDAYWRSASRIGQLLIDLEFTRKILEVHERRDETGQWPDAMPGIEESECADDTWHYRRVDGGFDLWLEERDVSWRDDWSGRSNEPWLAPRHEERRP